MVPKHMGKKVGGGQQGAILIPGKQIVVFLRRWKKWIMSGKSGLSGTSDEGKNYTENMSEKQPW